MTISIHRVFTVAMTAIVLVAIVWGVLLVGSPWSARMQRFDQQRLEDLQTIFREIQLLCRDPDIKTELKRPLPATLAELAVLARTERIKLNDPETGEAYGYRILGQTSYELSATFATELDSDANVFWNHPAGRHQYVIQALDPPQSALPSRGGPAQF